MKDYNMKRRKDYWTKRKKRVEVEIDDKGQKLADKFNEENKNKNKSDSHRLIPHLPDSYILPKKEQKAERERLARVTAEGIIKNFCQCNKYCDPNSGGNFDHMREQYRSGQLEFDQLVKMIKASIEIDHMDTNPRNNRNDNLMAMSRNCHSIKTDLNKDWKKKAFAPTKTKKEVVPNLIELKDNQKEFAIKLLSSLSTDVQKIVTQEFMVGQGKSTVLMHYIVRSGLQYKDWFNYKKELAELIMNNATDFSSIPDIEGAKLTVLSGMPSNEMQIYLNEIVYPKNTALVCPESYHHIANNNKYGEKPDHGIYPFTSRGLSRAKATGANVMIMGTNVMYKKLGELLDGLYTKNDNLHYVEIKDEAHNGDHSESEYTSESSRNIPSSQFTDLSRKATERIANIMRSIGASTLRFAMSGTLSGDQLGEGKQKTFRKLKNTNVNDPKRMKKANIKIWECEYERDYELFLRKGILSFNRGLVECVQKNSRSRKYRVESIIYVLYQIVDESHKGKSVLVATSSFSGIFYYEQMLEYREAGYSAEQFFHAVKPTHWDGPVTKELSDENNVNLLLTVNRLQEGYNDASLDYGVTFKTRTFKKGHRQTQSRQRIGRYIRYNSEVGISEFRFDVCKKKKSGARGCGGRLHNNDFIETIKNYVTKDQQGLDAFSAA